MEASGEDATGDGLSTVGSSVVKIESPGSVEFPIEEANKRNMANFMSFLKN